MLSLRKEQWGSTEGVKDNSKSLSCGGAALEAERTGTGQACHHCVGGVERESKRAVVS